MLHVLVLHVLVLHVTTSKTFLQMFLECFTLVTCKIKH